MGILAETIRQVQIAAIILNPLYYKQLMSQSAYSDNALLFPHQMSLSKLNNVMFLVCFKIKF